MTTTHHPPQKEEPPHLAADLRTLCLPAIAAHWQRLAEEARRQRQGHSQYLADLVSLELSGRQERRIARLAGEARFPIRKTLDGFGFAAQPAVDREAVLELATGAYARQAANVVLLGAVGTGKTLLTITLQPDRDHQPPFARWSEVFQDAMAAAAVIDRIVHYAVILKTEGDSYRLKEARRSKRASREEPAP